MRFREYATPPIRAARYFARRLPPYAVLPHAFMVFKKVLRYAVCKHFFVFFFFSNDEDIRNCYEMSPKHTLVVTSLRAVCSPSVNSWRYNERLSNMSRLNDAASLLHFGV